MDSIVKGRKEAGPGGQKMKSGRICLITLSILAAALMIMLILQTTPAYAIRQGFFTESHMQTMTGTSQFYALDKPVESLDHAFVLVKYFEGQRTSACGTTAANVQLDPDYGEFSCYLYNTTHVLCERYSSTNDVYISYQVIEAIDSEFTVHRGSMAFSGSTTSFTTGIGASVNASESMAWVNGMQTTTTSRDHRPISFTADIEGTGMQSQVTFRRDFNTAITGTLRWIVVDWNRTKMPGFNLSKGTVFVGNNTYTSRVTVPWSGNSSNSILFHQIRTSGDDGLDTHAVAGVIDSDSQLSFWRYDYTGVPDHSSDVQYYVLDFSGNYAGGVKSSQENIVGPASQCVWDVTLPTEVDPSHSLISISNSMTGDGTAYPRPFFWFYLTSGTNLEIQKRYNGNNERVVWKVLELPYFPYSIEWNHPVLNLGSGITVSGNLTGSANISVEANQTGITVDCIRGNCSDVADDWPDGSSMDDGGSRQVNFTCINNSVGILRATFSVRSAEEQLQDLINITCEFTGSTFIAWNQSSLDLGTGSEGHQNATGSAFIVSTGTNSHVNVSCVSGNCSVIHANWTDGTGMADGESSAAGFSCDDTFEGSASASFSVVSSEDLIPDSMTVGCLMEDIDPPGGVEGLGVAGRGVDWIAWNWTMPADPDFDHVEVWLNSTFRMNTSSNSVNITGLMPGTWYEIELRSSDDDGNLNVTWVTDSGQTEPNFPPKIIMQDPLNSSTAPEQYRLLNLSVSDNEQTRLCVDMSGKVAAEPTSDDLLYRNCNFANGSSVTYNWTAPVLSPTTDSEVLWHFDNRSEYGENSSFVRDFAQDTTVHDLACTTECPVFMDNGGKFAGAFHYDGASQYWTISDQFFNDQFTNKSLQVWIKPDDLFGIQTIYEEGGTTNGFALRLEGSLLEFATQDNQVITEISYPYTDLGSWHFITAQYDAGNMTLYVDGTLVNTTTAGYTTISAHSDEGGIGYTYNGDAFDGSAGNYYSGMIDEVRILNTVLTGDEIWNESRLKNNTEHFWFAHGFDGYDTDQGDTWQFNVSIGSISWNSSSLDMGFFDPDYGNQTSYAGIEAFGPQSGIDVACDSGDCGLIISQWPDGTGLADMQSMAAGFRCLNTSMGVFSAVFNVTSDQDPLPDQINVSCEMLTDINIIWNTTLLNLGTGNEREGDLTAVAGIKSNGINSNATITCSSGNCSKITVNITDRFNMSDGQNASAMFKCNDSQPGFFSAVYSILSDDDPEPSLMTVECSMLNPPPPTVSGLNNDSISYDWIRWSWTNPAVYDFDHVEVWLNSSFIGNMSLDYANITGLVPGTEYQIMLRTVDIKGNINTTWVSGTARTIFNNPVGFTLNSPENGSSDPTTHRLLDVSVEDVESSRLCVELFGRESSSPDGGDLLYRNCSVANGTSVIYDWTSPVLEPDPDVEVLWHFDNRSGLGESGSSVRDFADDTTIHNLSCTTECPLFVDNGGKFAGAFHYDGASQYWTISDQFFNDQFTNKSLQVWIKPDDLFGIQTIYEEGGTTNGFALRLEGSLLEFATQDNQVITEISYPYTDLGSWHFITAQYDAGNMTLYVDGTLVNTTTASYSTVSAHGDEGGIGYTYNGDAFDAGAGNYYAGMIDEIRILNTVLDSSEVMDSYRLNYGSVYRWFANATDDYQTWKSSHWEFTLKDITPPAVFIDAGLNNTITDDTTPVIDFNFTDSYSQTANCSLYIDSVPLGSSAYVANSTQTAIAPVSPLADANHTAYINCTDESGNAGISGVIYIASDSMPPYVNLLSPANGTLVNYRNSVNISANVSDNFAVRDVFALIEWGSGSVLQEMLDFEGDDIYDTLFLNTNSLGRYNVTIIANDTAGNMNDGAKAWFNVTKDMNPPKVSINSSQNDTITPDSNPSVGFMFTDKRSPTANCTLLFDSGSYGTAYYVDNDTWTTISANKSLSDANYTVHVNCTDESGNIGKSSSIHMAVDTTPPSVVSVLPSPGSGYYLFDIVNITANVTDIISLGKVYALIDWSEGSSLQQMDDPAGDGTFETGFFNTADIGRYDVTIIANDTSGHSNNSEKSWFWVSTDSALNLTAISPYNKSGDPDGVVDFVFNLSSKYTIDNCSVLLNNSASFTGYSINRTGTNTIHAEGLDIGEYSWRIACHDMYGGWNKSSLYRLTVLRATEFGGQTLDFSQSDMENISDLALETSGAGMINFTGSLDLSAGLDLDRYINISSGYIGLDAAMLPALNRSARLTFYSLTYRFMPIPAADGSPCTGGLCSGESYDSASGTFSMDVAHFTGYSTTPNSRLAVYDDGDSGKATVMHSMIGFYANYSNRTTGLAIAGPGVWCRISFGSGQTYGMAFDPGSGLYELNRSFDYDGKTQYNVTCEGNSLGYEKASAADSISISRDRGYLKDGNCTIEYIQKGSDFKQGYLHKDDEARIYCQSPLDLTGGEKVKIILVPNSGVETRKSVTVPDAISSKYEILYP